VHLLIFVCKRNLGEWINQLKLDIHPLNSLWGIRNAGVPWWSRLSPVCVLQNIPGFLLRAFSESFLKHYKFTKRSAPSPRVKSRPLDRGWSSDPWISRHQGKNSESALFEQRYMRELNRKARRKLQAP
jgi:hypothetical protein